VGCSKTKFEENVLLTDIAVIICNREYGHQLIRRGYNSIAHFFTYPILQVPKDSLTARFVFLGLVFGVSAVFHFLCDIALGIPVHGSGALVFFFCQIPAVMLEEMVPATGTMLVVRSGRFGMRRHEKFSFYKLAPQHKRASGR
jgi:hypothetical protein